MKPTDRAMELKLTDLILRRREAPSRRMAAGSVSLVAVLRDARNPSRRAPQAGHVRLRMTCALLRVGLNIKAHVSSPGQTPRKHANAGKEHPRLGAGDCFLEIFGQASTAVEPSKRSFNHPASPFGLERADTL